MALFTQLQSSLVIAADAVCPAKPKVFAVWPFTEEVLWTLHKSSLPSAWSDNATPASVLSVSFSISILQYSVSLSWGCFTTVTLISYHKTLFRKQTYFQNTSYLLYAILLLLYKAKQYAGITTALYILRVLLSFAVVKKKNSVAFKNTSFPSHLLSSVVGEMLKLCCKVFHIWGSKLKKQSQFEMY